MGDLGEQDGYPVGVSNADFAGDDLPCVCGHAADEHLDCDMHGSEACEVEDCDCICYEADYEPQED